MIYKAATALRTALLAEGLQAQYTALDQAKLIIYVMTSSILKINPQYFSDEALAAIAKNEVELIRQLKELDEGVTLNKLIVSVFNKKEFH